MRKKKSFINTDIVAISVFISVLFIALAVFFVIYLSNDAGTVINNPYNRRSENLKQKVVRGAILSEDEDVLAYSEDTERLYPFGREFAHVVGFETKGGLGLESSFNYYLLSPGVGFFKNISNEINGIKSPGKNIKTTLDLGLQEEAYNALNGISGGVIIVDPDTGSIKALVSAPDFAPETISEEWDNIISDENNGVLFNRVTQGAILPGELEIGGRSVDFDIFTEKSAFNVEDKVADDGYATLLQYAKVTSAFANEGNLADFRLVSEICDSENNVLKKFDVKENAFISKEELAELLPVMKENVDNGDCSMVGSEGFDTYAVKGECTAIDPDAEYEYEHSYFFGFTQKGDEKIVVCVMIENKQESETEAIVIAGKILDYYYRQVIHD